MFLLNTNFINIMAFFLTESWHERIAIVRGSPSPSICIPFNSQKGLKC